MIILEQYKAFAYYNKIFNRQLYKLAEGLEDNVRKANLHAFFGSIEGTLNHILLTDRIWLARFRNCNINGELLKSADLVDDFTSLNQELYSQFSQLQSERFTTDQILMQWIDTLTEQDLVLDMVYSNSQGVKRCHPAWLAISHLFNHQTHHRGQITTLFSQLGIDSGITDFLVIVNQQN